MQGPFGAKQRDPVKLSIVFADIAGSTRLYELLGDAQARALIADCLGILSEQTARYGGKVIKTIGDELMSTFPCADPAVEAAMAMQDAVVHELPRRNSATPADMAVRIGLHHGPAILDDGDVFGDAVNVAARMAAAAKGRQIITTRETAEGLGISLRSTTRHLDRIAVRGKIDDIDIYEVIWQADDVTRMATDVIESLPRSAVLSVEYRGTRVEIDQNTAALIMGRGKLADVVIEDAMASREHARIECRRGKFVLIDMSTNGTYLLTPEGPAYLRRGEQVLTGSGQIALGRQIAEVTHVVTYRCE
jgi:class 3 adenylate cyclase